MDTKTLLSLLYPNQQENINNIQKLYLDSGDFVFRRKKHNNNQYASYLKANGGVASRNTLTTPAFPTYLLPPDNIINELEKSPRLTIKIEGFRKSNWSEIIGEFYCKIDDIEEEINPKKKNRLGTKEKLINYLAHKNYDKSDEYIYSIYTIVVNKDNPNEIKFICSHLYDITQKSKNNYSVKSDSYTQNIQSYYVIVNLETLEIITK